MHTMWKGAISFGLVHIPIKMHAATEEKSPKFRYLHKTCHTPIQYVKRCPTCKVDVAWEEIVRGLEYEEGRFIILEEEEIEELKGEAARTIEITDFVSLEEIDPIYFDHSYYLSPQEGGGKPYRLLQAAMQESGKIGIARFRLRSKESLAAIRTYRHLLLLETLFYPDEIRDASQVPMDPASSPIEERETSMAMQLIEQLTTPFRPEKYTDRYREALAEYIKGKKAVEAPAAAEKERGGVMDLMEALKKSIEMTGTGDGKKKRGRPKKVREKGA